MKKLSNIKKINAMKKIIFVILLALSFKAESQVLYDTLISISPDPTTGIARKAAPAAYTWDLTQQVMILAVTVFPVNNSGVIINTSATHKFVIPIDTYGICVKPTGQEWSCDSTGVEPQYTFLRALSLKPVSIMSQLLQYINIADDNGIFNTPPTQ